MVRVVHLHDDEVLDAKLLGMELHGFERVDHRRREALGQREGRIMLGIAANLQHALAEFRKGDGKIR